MCLVSDGLPRWAFHIFWSDWWVLTRTTEVWPCTRSNVQIRQYFFSGALILYVIYVIIVIAEHFAEDLAGSANALLNSKSKMVKNASDANVVVDSNENLFKQFSASINPIDLTEWNSSECIGKIWQILKVWKFPKEHIEKWTIWHKLNIHWTFSVADCVAVEYMHSDSWYQSANKWLE